MSKFNTDAAVSSISVLAALELLLAMKMSAINGEQMAVARRAKDPRSAAAAFLRTVYYKKWSRAQLNNTEYAPMLGLLMLVIKYKADRENRKLDTLEKLSCVGAAGATLTFLYGVLQQGKIDHRNMRPGQSGMSIFRPIGALSRYMFMGALIYCALRNTGKDQQQ